MDTLDNVSVAYPNVTMTMEGEDTEVGKPSNCSNDYCVTDEEYYEMIFNYVFPRWYEWIIFVVYIAVFFIGLVGNFLVCFVVYRVKTMQTVTNTFIVNLAAGDFMVILICLPPTLLWDTWETWFFGYELCKLVLYLQVV